MAVRDVVLTKQHANVIVASWFGLADGDTGEPAFLAHWPDKTVQAVGDATTVAIEGSNDGENWFPVRGGDGNAVALVAGTFDGALLVENPLYLRPVATGGADTAVIIAGASDR